MCIYIEITNSNLKWLSSLSKSGQSDYPQIIIEERKLDTVWHMRTIINIKDDISVKIFIIESFH